MMYAFTANTALLFTVMSAYKSNGHDHHVDENSLLCKQKPYTDVNAHLTGGSAVQGSGLAATSNLPNADSAFDNGIARADRQPLSKTAVSKYFYALVGVRY